ncbi:unnamed protein product [Paramecium sonneborni]|uniref:Uncharacterized protein n=1 Tax=Paramecium sonneborni TaxID=65129 RepID=A0A8S1R9J7_9CILI|nr:unnamed protein product [Paramecium sonneborni]
MIDLEQIKLEQINDFKAIQQILYFKIKNLSSVVKQHNFQINKKEPLQQQFICKIQNRKEIKDQFCNNILHLKDMILYKPIKNKQSNLQIYFWIQKVVNQELNHNIMMLQYQLQPFQ